LTPLSFALSNAIKFIRLSPVIVSASAKVITSSAKAVEKKGARADNTGSGQPNFS
jgi:hypothetical protein